MKINRKDLLFNGVYKIINTINNKIYIGSCSSKTFIYERLSHHKNDLKNNKHCNKYLQKSVNKYGLDNFTFEILEKCQPEECIIKEQYYIDTLKPEYNLQKIAGNSLGRECLKETRNKISKSNKLFWSNSENKERMLNSFYIRKKREVKPKIKKEFHGGCKKVIDLNSNIVYNSVIELSKDLNKTYTYLIAILNNKRASSNLNIKYYE